MQSPTPISISQIAAIGTFRTGLLRGQLERCGLSVFHDSEVKGGLGGILSRSADALLDGLGRPQRDKALKLLFQLVQVDPEGRRHTRRRMPPSTRRLPLPVEARPAGDCSTAWPASAPGTAATPRVRCN